MCDHDECDWLYKHNHTSGTTDNAEGHSITEESQMACTPDKTLYALLQGQKRAYGRHTWYALQSAQRFMDALDDIHHMAGHAEEEIKAIQDGILHMSDGTDTE